MNKTELIAKLAKKQSHLTIKDARLSVDIILTMIQEGLNASNRIEIRGFGAFSLRFRPSRTRINLKTGQELHLPAHYACRFKPAKELKLRVNQAAQGSPTKPRTSTPILREPYTREAAKQLSAFTR